MGKFNSKNSTTAIPNRYTTATLTNTHFITFGGGRFNQGLTFGGGIARH